MAAGPITWIPLLIDIDPKGPEWFDGSAHRRI